MGHVDEREIVADPRVPLGPRLRAAEDLVHRQRHVLVDGEPGQERMILEDDGAVRARTVDLLVVEKHGAVRHLGEPRDDVQEGGLAAARVADDRHILARLDRQVDVAEHVGRRVAPREGFVDVVELQEGLGHRGLPCGQEADVPRVTMDPSAATSRSRTKPTAPM